MKEKNESRDVQALDHAIIFANGHLYALNNGLSFAQVLHTTNATPYIVLHTGYRDQIKASRLTNNLLLRRKGTGKLV